MKKPQFLVLVAVLVVSPVRAAEPAHWNYILKGGEDWARLDPAYATCGSGRQQSPIDLKDFTLVELEQNPVRFVYRTGAHKLLNNGRTVQVEYTIGSELFLDDHRYELKRYSFHRPGEHYINSWPYPLEVQFYHEDGKKRIVMVSVLFVLGKENPALNAIFDYIPKHGGDGFLPHHRVSARDLVPEDKSYYRYQGSLTTPPCTEGVTWLVMRRPLKVSLAQLKKFKEMFPNNNRSLQELNGREVLLAQ